jgi:hypothetical protein
MASAGSDGGRRNSITPSRRRRVMVRRELTVVQLEEFGFLSVLRDVSRAVIIIARFDRTVLIGT